MLHKTYSSQLKNNRETGDPRLRIILGVFFLFALCIIVRLVYLMYFQHSFYLALANGSQEVYSKLFPVRGTVYWQDSRTGEEYPIAMNRDYFLLYADTRQIKDDQTATDITQKLAEIFGYNDEKKLTVFQQLNKRTDPYEPLELKVEDSIVEKLKALKLTGLGFIRKPFRVYPESNLTAHIVGFLGKDNNGNDIGRYGIEGYWQKELAGKGGLVTGAKSALGAIIPLAGGSFMAATDGADIILTIDRTLQYQACEKLNQARKEYGAVNASLVIMEPKTGEILAMCSSPDFDPNKYNEVKNAEEFNNTSIFTPYEPGSVIKGITMAMGMNDGVVTPDSWFNDTGSRTGVCETPIRNADDKVYGNITMNNVLEDSVNTGMVYVAEKVGKEKFNLYLKDFGFGIRTGLELDGEMPGNVDSLYLNKKNKFDCYTATAAFGQGITATPLQLASAFSVLANGGTLMKPYIVKEIRYSDGRKEKFTPKELKEVISKRTSMFISGMLTSVVDNGHGKSARVPGYFVAGKTGTAQIAGRGGYSADTETNHTFIGYVPSDNPKFVMVVKFERPQRVYAESTSSLLFSSLSKFALQYYGIAPSR